MAKIESIQNLDLTKYFPASRQWQLVELTDSQVDRRPTFPGSTIRCIDRRFGITADGNYNPDLVSPAPAWLGASDGVAAFYSGKADERMEKAVTMIRRAGFEPANHGDFDHGYMGCKFRKAWIEEQFPELLPISIPDLRVLQSKLGIKHDRLYNTSVPVEGFLLNLKPSTYVLPEGGKYYPVEGWFPEMVAIDPAKALRATERCGELLLPPEQRVLYLVR